MRAVTPSADRDRRTAHRPPRTQRCTSAEANARVIDILVEAFAEDPLYQWLINSADIRRRALRDNFTVVVDAGVANGDIDTTTHGDAAAIWTPPGVALFGDPTAMQTVLSRWVSPDRLAAASRAMTECARHQPTDAAVLHVIGVRPQHVGTGIGSDLVRPRLAALDRKGSTAYLESSNPRNHSFYVRHGFRSVADTRLGDSGPFVTCMVREPSRSAT